MVVVREEIKVLLVDDEPAVLRALELLLRSVPGTSLSVRSTSNPLEAVELIESTEVFDLLVTDLRMNPIDGFELVEIASKARPNMKIVVVSAYINDALIKRMSSMGCRSFIRKPFKRIELIDCLADMFPAEI